MTAARTAGAAAVCKADFEVKSAAPLQTLNWRFNSTIIVNTVKAPSSTEVQAFVI